MPEKNYLALAKKSITRPSAEHGFRKILIYARNKKGKTYLSLSAGIPRTLLLDPESGTDVMHRLRPYRWPLTKWEDVADAYGALRTGKLSPAMLGLGPEKEPFDWVSVDGLTRINNMALHYVRKKREEANLETRPGMIDRRDYNKSGELMKGLLTNFHTLPMNVVFTTQERAMTSDGGEEEEEDLGTQYVPDLPQSVRGTANALVEVIGRLYMLKVPFKNPKHPDGEPIYKMQRRLWIAPHTSFDTGYRSDFELPDFVRNPTLPKLTSLVTTGEERSA